MIEHLYLFLILALVAEVLGTIGGFGSSMFFVPIAAFFLDFQTVLGITALFHLSSNLTKLALFRKGIDKTLIIYLGIPAILFVILGALLSKFIDGSELEVGLSVFLIIMSTVLLINRNFSVQPTKKNSIIGGIASGFTAGLLGTGGAIRGLTLSSFALAPELFIATSALIDLGVDAGRSIIYATNGFIQTEYLYLLLPLLVASLIGTYLGKLIIQHITPERFRTIVLLLVIATGVATLVRIYT